MTIRTRTLGRVTVHAGPAGELAALALDYAAGKHRHIDDGQALRFTRAAADLKNGYREASTDGVWFWADGPDGAPFPGNRDYRPDPDPAWAAEAARKALET